MDKQRNRPRATAATTRGLRRRRSGIAAPWWLVGGFGVMTVAILAVVALGISASAGGGEDSHPGLVGSPAIDFSLPTVGGGTFSSVDYRGEKNVLVFFNEGHGCDACFTQIVDLQKVKADIDATDTVMVAVMINAPDVLAKEAKRFGIDTNMFPMASDEDGSVGKKYGAWGKGMHAANYGHGFVLIDKQGVVRWQVEEPSMYVPPKLILDKLREVNAS